MRRLIAAILAVPLLCGTARATDPLPQIWFNPHGPALDLLNMWTDDAPWPEATKKVQVLVLVHWWILQQTDQTLAGIIAYAKQHHMLLDLSTEPIAGLAGDTCGNEEGYMGVPEIIADINTLQRLGARLDWVDMDQPVVAGHYNPAPGCKYAIPDLVNRVAMILNPIIAAYPNVRIMEIEPLQALTSQPTWRDDETAFHVGLSRQTGHRVLTMQADVQWELPTWRPAMLALRQYTREQNLGLSVIYDGNAQSQSDADWVNSAVSNFEAVEGALAIVPNQILFTSWNAYPTHNLPETDPTAQTWLISRYFRPRSTMQAHFVGRGVHGKLTTLDGKPIANVTVNGYQPGVDLRKPLPVQTLTGVVPPGATQALLGVHVNVECGCSGINDLLIGPISYQETRGGTSSGSYALPTRPTPMNGAIIDGQIVGGSTVTRIIAFPSQGLYLNNSVGVPVTANAQFQLSVPTGSVGGRGWFGNIIIIFFDAHGNGTRFALVPQAGKTMMSTTTTNADGTFSLSPLPRGVDSPLPVTVEFDGANGAYRSAVWSPAH
jgi:hypothetical protein